MVRSTALHIKPVAGRTSKLLEQGLTVLGQRARNRATRHPGLVVSRFHDYDFADHSRVHGTAVLGAEKMVSPSLGRPEPHGGIAARNHIHLDAKGGHVKAVDDVLRGHDQLSV